MFQMTRIGVELRAGRRSPMVAEGFRGGGRGCGEGPQAVVKPLVGKLWWSISAVEEGACKDTAGKGQNSRWKEDR